MADITYLDSRRPKPNHDYRLVLEVVDGVFDIYFDEPETMEARLHLLKELDNARLRTMIKP